MSKDNKVIRLGLRENLGQFSLLVLINVFVGVMVGLERTVVPLIGEREFGLVSKTAIVSFIVSFGVTKAIFNLFAAHLSETAGRKKILVGHRRLHRADVLMTKRASKAGPGSGLHFAVCARTGKR